MESLFRIHFFMGKILKQHESRFSVTCPRARKAVPGKRDSWLYWSIDFCLNWLQLG